MTNGRAAGRGPGRGAFLIAVAVALFGGADRPVTAQTQPYLGDVVVEVPGGPAALPIGELLLGAMRGTLEPVLQAATGAAAQQVAALEEEILRSPLGPITGPIFATYSRGAFEPPVAIDWNDAPDVVEVIIVAIPTMWEFHPGIPTAVWTFNGTIPGPTIEAKLGDRVIVHFVNLIDTPGGLHWHGVEVPAVMDGSHLSAPPTMRGESFTYDFIANRASLFWYHPHHKADEQIERGLYGAFLVHDPETDTRLGLPENEILVVLDDVFLESDGQFFPFSRSRGGRLSRSAAWANYQTNGRDGFEEPDMIQIVNGRADRTLHVEPGVPLRLRLLNTANTTFMRVNVPPAASARTPDQPSEEGPGRACSVEEDGDRTPCHDLFLIGTDGGLLEGPRRRTPITQIVDPQPVNFGLRISDDDPGHGVILTPGERADVVFTPTGESGDLLPFEWHDWSRGRHMWAPTSSGELGFSHHHGSYPQIRYRNLFHFRLVGDGQPATWEPPAELREIPRLVDPNDLPPESEMRRLRLTMGNGAPDAQGNMLFWVQTSEDGSGIPWVAEHDDAHGHHGHEEPPPVANYVHQVTVGETAIWEVTNTAINAHNFHPHGFVFQPLSMEHVTCDPATGEIDPTKTVIEIFDDVREKDTIQIPRPPLPSCHRDSFGVWQCPLCPTGTSFTRFRAAMQFDTAGRDDIEAYGGRPETTAAGEPVRSGGWMVHCHILEHAKRGMMSYFEVRQPE